MYWYGFIDFFGIEKVYFGLLSKLKLVVCDVKKEDIVLVNINYYVLFGLNLIFG